MPILFYGTLVDSGRKRELHGVRLQPLESHLFDAFKLGKLAPYSRLPDVANHWHLVDRNHSALAWHTAEGVEQTVFVPGLHSAIDTIAIIREEYPGLLPSPLTLRVNNEEGAYLYHD